MPQIRYIRLDPSRIGPLGLFLGAVLATLLLIAAAFVGFFFFIAAIGLVVSAAIIGGVRRWWLRHVARRHGAGEGRGRAAPETLEAEYRVVRETRSDRGDRESDS